MTRLLFLSLLAGVSVALARPSFDLKFPRDSVNNAIRSTLTDETIATGWYPAWLSTTFPPSTISWTKYNLLTFAFAVTTPDTSVISLDSASEAALPTFVTLARTNNVSPLLSIGGWTGSAYFSTAVATAANRTTFVKAVVDLVTKYKLDGIDFDWEAPNQQGIGCNAISSADSANFLLFLDELRQDPVGTNIILSGAVGLNPYMGPDGKPLADVSDFAKYFDFIAIMNYDVWGSWSAGVGPNAPLNDACAPTPAGSAVSALAAWTAAGFPENQIVLGVAAYGHSFKVKKTDAFTSSGSLASYPPFDKSAQPLGEGEDGSITPDACGTPTGPSGIFNFEGLVRGGFLNENGTAASGITYTFDKCSQTPFVYNSTSEVMISYDDADSFAAKGKFIDDKRMRGFAIWHVVGDYQDILLDSISGALGLDGYCD